MKPWMTCALVVLALAACGQPNASQATPQPQGEPQEADPAAMPPMDQFAPPPPPEPVRPVQPLSNTAAAITGAATFAAGQYRFDLGQTYKVRPESKMGADLPWSARGKSWAELLGVDTGGEVELVRVVEQAIDRSRARNGSLCGGQRPVRWIALARSGEDVGAEVHMAAFSGDRPPGPAGSERDLCGTFNYAAGN
ncbi:MAG: hypothetical protein K1X35_12515 [Caulobacteraceae bacterium]|nr:hypothetical protein [Caulobacteraceae bacterium]